MEETSLQKKLMNFLYKNSNIFLILILIFALIIRLKYLSINQAVWYDEAAYLGAAKAWTFGIPYELHYVRPALLPFIFSIFYKLGATEFTFRILMLLFSMVGIFFTYLLGKEFFEKRIALIATFILSFFYVHLFYTARLLTGMPTLTIWLVSIWLFWKGYINKDSKYYLWLFGLVFILGTLMRFPFGLVAILILLYLVLTEGFKFLKNKDLWIAGLISVVIFIPYGIWYYSTYARLPILGAAGFYESVNYFSMYLTKVLPTVLVSPIPWISGTFPLLGSFFIVLLAIGILTVLFKLILSFNRIKNDSKLKKYLFTLLWLIIPFLYFAFLAGQFPEDRYLFYSYPPVFFLIGFVLVKFYDKIKKINLTASTAVAILIAFMLITTSMQNLQLADNVINSRATSYIQFKQSGEWIKENSLPEEKVVAAGVPQLSYYSERRIIYWPETEEAFETLLQEDKTIKYLILSGLEGSPQWTYSWPEKNQDRLIPAQAYLDPAQRPVLIVYELKR